jgi:replication initiation and membrane attachment protein DnaB
VCLTNEVSEKLAKYGILFEKSCQNGFLQNKKRKKKNKKRKRKIKKEEKPKWTRSPHSHASPAECITPNSLTTKTQVLHACTIRMVINHNMLLTRVL